MTLTILFLVLNFTCAIFGAHIFHRSLNVTERIVTNYGDVLKGVPVDFRYNQSDTLESGLSSVPGCPKSEEGIPWVYYDSKCYLAFERGPCGIDEILFIQFGSPLGICNCDCFAKDGETKTGFDFSKMQFCTKDASAREYVFHPERKKCYSLFDQGPCKSNEWLVKNKAKNNSTSTLNCEPRKCPSGQLPYWDERNAGDKKFEKENCFAPMSPYFSPVSINPNSCGKGSKYSRLLRKCIRNIRASNIGR